MERITIKQTKELDYKTVEAFRVLRANLEQINQAGKVISITSVMGKEGKSFVAFQTAAAMAAAGKSCVYVDMNLRAASELYDMAEARSNTVSACLEGRATAQDIVSETGTEGLYMAASGAPCRNASELLSGEACRRLIADLRERYDYVIIDTPAVGEVADALIASRSADGVVLVMEPELVPYEQAQKAKSQLELNGCRVLGVVLNK